MDFSIFDHFEEEVVVIDKNYRIVYANRKYAEDMGYSDPEEIIGDFCYTVSHHQDQPCEGECHPCPLREIEKTGKSVNVVHTHYTHDDREVPVEICAFPIENGEKIVQIIRDIRSDKKKYYLFSLSQKLSSVGFLALGIAHQLSTPLGTILLALEDLEEKLGASDETELIRNAVNTCKDYVDKLLFLVKRSSNRDLVNITKSVSDAVDLLKVYAKEKGVSLEFELEEVGYFLANETDIRHLVLNLVLNAIQASPEGEKVHVRLYREEGRWILEVADHGPGIDQEELSKIFIPFYQGKNKKEGSGLGLAIVDSIVREYGGSIDVKSTPGEGSTFKVSVPIPQLLEFPENGSPATP
ncbi:two-component system sensor histidine kinase NtrB [Hydrogenivirga caldilitoris]|uniref:two-component system sensor histidine kinase NtrB n=1 Tax=Hydrogenivirga caldilitoris TaxID=246264 RepID=UPI000EB3A84A|nr:PAS domain-containing sensor histidine kinase [Hydrogenivirga caldilitoris]